MFGALRKKFSLASFINNGVVDYPTSINLSYWWNFGSLLGMCLVLQVITGIFLSIHYVAHVDLAFFSVFHLINDVNYGWLLRFFHVNGSSLFFIFLYLHIGRGLYYGSFKAVYGWLIGVVLFILVIAIAFLGYVLPWGQISFWGATVITNFFSAVPYVGGLLVEWLWGGFAVDRATLTRFYSFHFLFPFLVMGLRVLHLVFLHEIGANSPLGLFSFGGNVPFHPYFSLKDFFGLFIVFFLFILVVFLYPFILVDPENFISANSLVTPIHIQPEWYFLFAYAILRAVPYKLGGVLALLCSVLVLFLMPFLFLGLITGEIFYPINQVLFWFFVNIFFFLTWLGRCPVEAPFIIFGQVFSFFFFFFLLFYSFFHSLRDNLLISK